MGFNLGRIFVPKNKIFYDLFEDVVATVNEMANLLKIIVHEPILTKGMTQENVVDLREKTFEIIKSGFQKNNL